MDDRTLSDTSPPGSFQDGVAPVRAGASLRHAPSRRLEITATVEQLIVVTALFWTLSANRGFLGAALARNDPAAGLPGAGFVAALLLILFCAHVLLLGLLAGRHTVKPLVAVLTIAGAAASHFMSAYGVVIDPTMVRNIVHTHPAEAGELLSARLLLHLALYAGLPLLLLWRVRIVRQGRLRAARGRAGLLALAALMLTGAVFAEFQTLASHMRNDKALRYRITPANVVWSVASVAGSEAQGAARPRVPIGLDAAQGPSWRTRERPLVLVMVVGETARAANWGLSGYARQTTPELSRLPVVNFPDVRACGTNTEVSLPCMFAPVGRRDYDEGRIRGQESLLHVLARAGATVNWRDNQSGCKGTCEGLPNDRVETSDGGASFCAGGQCRDEGLVHDLDARLSSAKGTQVWVLHMLGNHGPAYFRRYPPVFAKFLPDCRSDDLSVCTREEIVNSYDNALLYTDHLLSRTIARLNAHAGAVDSALLYVSDHGESLGEHGLFLHGAPYAIAPDVQTHVPMVFWASQGFARGAGLREGCLEPALRRAAALPLAHDNLFHTIAGLLDVHTSLHAPSLDLVDDCRRPQAGVG